MMLKEELSWENSVPPAEASPSDQLELLREENSFISEQFRSLRVRLHLSRERHPLNVLTVSSPAPGDGKSLLSSNLALCLSKSRGHRVMLLDCDFRNPTIHQYFGISLEPGLIGHLENPQTPPQRFTRRFGELYIMTAGGISDNPGQFIFDERMKELIESLKNEFDFVILDSPPLLPVSDTRILSRLADGVLLVIRRGKTPYSNVEKAFRALDPEKVLGVIFNEVPPARFNTYYDYRYYQYGRNPYNRQYRSSKK